MPGTRDRARRLTTGIAAGALLVLGLSPILESAYPEAAVEPSDALTLVRQALAALEVSPPDDLVATGKILKALFARDTRGVDMAHVHEAAQAIGMRDSATAAAQLIDALRPARMGPGGIDVALLVPVQPHFAGTPTAYILLVAAALLLAAGGLILRR